MILQALTAYYEQLLRQGKLKRPGWNSALECSFQLRINATGQMLDLVSIQNTVTLGKKQVQKPAHIIAPLHSGRSGKNPPPYFLCDNIKYMFGITTKKYDTEKTQQIERIKAKERFEDCKKYYHKVLEGTESPIADAILKFFDQWNPSTAYENPIIQRYWSDLQDNVNLVFCVETTEGSVLATEDPEICSAWQQYYDSSDQENGGNNSQCLITGEKAVMAPVHPLIKGVRGTQSSGAALVSFNAPAFWSYGHEYGENAPIGKYGAFAYTTALNTLLSQYDHRCYIGDTTVVCWAETASVACESLGMMGMFGSSEESGIKEDDIAKALELLSQGMTCEFMHERVEPDQRFYVLGLAPNAGRISVRFFYCDTFGVFASRLRRHADYLRIVRPAGGKRENLSIWSLAAETVNKKANNPTPLPQLTGDLLRAVLTGGRYPATLINGVMLRIRAEYAKHAKDDEPQLPAEFPVTRGRAAIIKAYYLRNTTNDNTLIPKEVLMEELNEQSSYLPYVLGRLFAVLEEIQNVANPGINTTIKNRYFASASATPAVVFPTIVNLAQKHLSKLDSDEQRKKYIYYSNLLNDLFDKIGTTYPSHMGLPEQGAYQIGYYHQTLKRFTKKGE